ncbi:related to MET2 - homoserine O-acetyltransferase [Melanopsichium pennsylvanicum]|uniref:Related to MET2 - homoserine O-acetyltransferase n=2 Tax=Melanopsichium pennsylvanicum TaxID=63383 RepID=A0AAJ5C6J2_9BASI|nr:related to MET2 - homoserine O-acetyltransferase [Melanopsichium pennsylvanicum]
MASLHYQDHLLPAPTEFPGPTSPQSSLLFGRQRYLLFPRFTLESGVVLHNLPIAFKTWGRLSDQNDNALVVCHALTGSADVEDWWGPLLGVGKVFDYSRFFIVCCNVLGSPYGSASPCTQAQGESYWANAINTHSIHKATQEKQQGKGQAWWGPEFPATTVRDDVRLQKLVLEYLGVHSIAAVVGGSMGGMAVLEWPLVFPTRFPGQNQKGNQRYIQAIVPLATSARHSAWCISWAEAQRQSIYSDPAFKHGYYDPDQPPRNGLSAARMAALLTYRSRDSFESRFGRRVGKALKGGYAGLNGVPKKEEEQSAKKVDEDRRSSLAQDAAAAHNEGNLSPRVKSYCSNTCPTNSNGTSYFPSSTHHPNNTNNNNNNNNNNNFDSNTSTNSNGPSLSPTATTPPVPNTPHPPTELSDEALSNTTLPPPVTAVAAVAAQYSVEPFSPSTAPQIFSAQSYLRYQGDKFVKRFDANCYIHLTRKMDSHDVARNRWGWYISTSTTSCSEITSVCTQVGERPENDDQEDEALLHVLNFLSCHEPSEHKAQPPAVLVVSIESDGLFAPPEQVLIHRLIKGSRFVSVRSSDGHDGFLLEFEQINELVGDFLKQVLANIYERVPDDVDRIMLDHEIHQIGGEGQQGVVKESVFGEVEDVTRW